MMDEAVPDNGWEQLRANLLYRPYQLPRHAEPFVTRVLSEPGCFAIVAGASFGKTALLHYLWQRLQKQNMVVVGYVFHHEDRNQVPEAIKQIRLQLGQFNLAMAGGPERPEVPWLQIEQAAKNGWPIAVLIDALDESVRGQWGMVRSLLPPFLPAAAKLVVTSRVSLTSYRTPLAGMLPPDRLFRLGRLSKADTRGLVRQTAGHDDPQLASRAHEHACGHPLQVTAILNSGDPEGALAQTSGSLWEPARVVESDLNAMERQAGAEHRSLLKRLQVLLAVARQPLTFDDLCSILDLDGPSIEALEQLLERLARHIAQDGANYRLASPDVHSAILADEAKGLAPFARPAREIRARLQDWYCKKYLEAKGADLRHLPQHVLHYAPGYLLNAKVPEQFQGEQIFVDPRWRDAIDCGFETIAELRAVVRTTWRTAEEQPEPCSCVLGVTTAATVLTSLVAAFPPVMLADLVRRKIVDERQARVYAQAYRSSDSRAALEQLLRNPSALPDYPLANHVVALDGFSVSQQHRILNQLHRKQLHLRHARVGDGRRKRLLDAIDEELVSLRRLQHTGSASPELSVPLPGRTLPVLINNLREALATYPLPAHDLWLLVDDPPKGADQVPVVDEGLGGDAAPLGLTYLDGLAEEHTTLLGEIASVWTPTLPDSHLFYAQVTRLIADGNRAAYFDGLITLIPAIGRVFGSAYLEQMRTIISEVTAAYP